MMNYVGRLLAFACILALATGCSERNQVGASASSERSAGTSLTSGYKQSDTLTVSRDLSTTVNIPAAPVIFDALRVDVRLVRNADPSVLELLVRRNLAGKARAGTLGADEKAAWDAIQHRDGLLVRTILTEALQPLQSGYGWPYEPFDTRTGLPQPRATAWAIDRYAGAQLANAVATRIATSMAGRLVRTSEEARARALDAFEALDHASLLAEYQLTRNSVSIRSMDGQQVHYVLNTGADVKIEPTGPVVALNNAPWFGNGTLSGKTYQFAMSKSVGDSSAESVDTSRDQTGGATQRTDSSAGTK